MAAVSTAQQTSIFYTKTTPSNGKASAKSKVVKRESAVRVSGQSDQIVSVSIVNETTLNVVFGNIYGVRKAQARLIDEEGKISKMVEVGALEGKE